MDWLGLGSRSRYAYGSQQQRRTRDPFVVLLLLRIAQAIHELPYKPPTTLLVMALNILVHFKTELLPQEVAALIPSIRQGCLLPAAIIHKGQWARLIWSAFLHVNDMHLYYNMTSFLSKGAVLERQLGSIKFAGLIAELLVIGHMLMAWGLSWVSDTFPQQWHMSHTCSAGFSGVLFALKYVLTYDQEGRSELFLGMLPTSVLSVPTKHLAWAELLLIHAMVPDTSFSGHLCGILAGMIHVHVIAKAWQLMGRQGRESLLRWLWSLVGSRRRRQTLHPTGQTAYGAANSRAENNDDAGRITAGRSSSNHEHLSAAEAAARAATRRFQQNMPQQASSRIASHRHDEWLR